MGEFIWIGLEDVRLRVERVAPRVDIGVLLTGETGTGKTEIAQLIHAGSPRTDAPFTAINCAAIPRELFESELFGHMKGAFSGATTDKEGLVVAANGGTLFLDEISELNAQLQAKLLHFIESKEYRRVGDAKIRKANVRIICATNLDLRGNSNFRQDLYYRISEYSLRIPALRERKQAIPEIVHKKLLEEISRGSDVADKLAPDAMIMLLSHEFLGNVRELQNLLKKCCVDHKGGGAITAADLLQSGFQGSTRTTLSPTKSASLAEITPPDEEFDLVSRTADAILALDRETGGDVIFRNAVVAAAWLLLQDLKRNRKARSGGSSLLMGLAVPDGAPGFEFLAYGFAVAIRVDMEQSGATTGISSLRQYSSSFGKGREQGPFLEKVATLIRAD